MVLARVFAAGFALTSVCLLTDAAPGGTTPVPKSSPEPGYWLVGVDGGVFAFNAPFEGSGAPAAGSPGLCPFAFGPTINISAASLANSGQVITYLSCVGIAGSGASSGYWIANFSSLPSAFGSATAPQELGCSGLNGAFGGWSGIAATPSGNGFFLVSENGAVLGCGDATPLGGVTNLPVARSIVGIASTHDGKGYWLVGSDGGVFSFGDAGFYGSMGGKALAPDAIIVGIAATPDGKGYWLVGSDGGVFSFGDATFFGSMGGQRLNRAITGIAANPDGPGYWLVAADGGVFAFGGAPFAGSLGGKRLNAPIVGIAAVPN
jgi:hypothetical protein